MKLYAQLTVELPAERSKARAAAAGVGGPVSAGSGSVLPEGVDMEKYVADIERSLLLAALAQSNGVQTRAAEVLKISPQSVMRDWKMARAWLMTELAR